jgi:hypothetical protein
MRERKLTATLCLSSLGYSLKDDSIAARRLVLRTVLPKEKGKPKRDIRDGGGGEVPARGQRSSRLRKLLDLLALHLSNALVNKSEWCIETESLLIANSVA